MTKASNKSKSKESTKERTLVEEDLSLESEVEEEVDTHEVGSDDREVDEESQKSNGSTVGPNMAGDTVPGTDYVYVSDKCCRAVYHGVGAKYTRNPYVCMGTIPCGGRAGGPGHKNVILKAGGQAEVGYYKGAFTHGNLFAARKDTKLNEDEVKELLDNAKDADRAYLRARNALSGNPIIEPSSLGVPDSVLGGSGIQEPSSPFKLAMANGGSAGQADLLETMIKLCTKIDDLGKTQEATNVAMETMGKTQKATNATLFASINHVGQSTSTDNLRSILKNSTRSEKATSKEMDHQSAITVGETPDPDEVSLNEMSSFSSNEGQSTRKDRSRPKHISKKSTSKEKERLVAVARGRGGSISVGLYREHYDDLFFLVDGYRKGRIKKVSSVKEGLSFINTFYKDRGLTRPQWLVKRQAHYPSLNRVKRHIRGSYPSSSDSSSSSDSFSDSSSSCNNTHNTVKRTKLRKKSGSSGGKKSKRPIKVNREHIGVDPSMGKDNELFNVNLKNVDALEDGLGISGLGKTTLRLLLEQIDDMTAYPRHSSTNTTEGLGELVDVVSNFSNQDQERHGGVTDTGWKHKHRNVLVNIKDSAGLTDVICFIQEEQHTILETCAGNMESILINSQVDSETAIEVVASSLAYRVSRDTLGFYFNLLNHLAGVASTLGWARSKEMIKYYGNRLG